MVPMLLLFLLPAFALGQIRIRVENDHNGELKVLYEGQDSRIIPDEERPDWKLKDEELKAYVGTLKGRVPTDVFLKSPTPWGDLYQTYNWAQVRRTLVVTGARIAAINMEPGVIIEEEFINNSTAKTIYSIKFEQQIQETISNTWSTNHQLKLGQSISFSLNALVKQMNATTSMSFTTDWGKSNTITKSVTIEYMGGGKFNVEPGESIKSAMHIQRGSMNIQVDYEASLQGIVASNYARKFEGDHFHHTSIQDVLKAGKSPSVIRVTENIRLGFYLNANFEVTNPTRQLTLYSGPLSVKDRE